MPPTARQYAKLEAGDECPRCGMGIRECYYCEAVSCPECEDNMCRECDASLSAPDDDDDDDRHGWAIQ
jgi:hypothetical protein